MPGYQLPPSPRPPVRSHGPDGWTRLLIVGGVAAAVTWFAWPYVRGEMAEIGRQMEHTRVTFPPTWSMRLDPTAQSPNIEDRRGETGGRGGDLDRLGPPERPWWAEGRGDARETTGGPPEPRYRDSRTAPDQQHVRRWRDCHVLRNGGMLCDSWQDGSPPGRR
jgi:hypothetical protein